MLKDDVLGEAVVEINYDELIPNNVDLANDARLLDDYIKDASAGVGRWNTLIRKTGIDFEIKLPHKGFSRKIGEFSEDFITTEGNTVRRHIKWASFCICRLEALAHSIFQFKQLSFCAASVVV